MRIFFALLTISVFPALLRSETACIVSPDTAQTHSFSTVAHRKLVWDEEKQSLEAIINFTNVPYADKDQPKIEEFFSFRFPGVTYDEPSRTFFVTGENGVKIPVALWKDGVISDWIEPGPKTQIFILKKSGRVEVTLAATTEDFKNPSGARWVERNEGWCLQNLLFERD